MSTWMQTIRPRISVKNIFILVLAIWGSSTWGSCSLSDLPSDFPESYKDFFQFTSSLRVKDLDGVDDCTIGGPRIFPWVFQCDSQGQFVEARALVFTTPKLEILFNQDRELVLNLSKGDLWDYSKVTPSEEAQIITRPGLETRMIFTTTSSRKVHLSLVKSKKNPNLEQLEVLVYKMAIGKPTLEDKFSCENLEN